MCRYLVPVLALVSGVLAQEPAGLEKRGLKGLPECPFTALSDRNLSRLGNIALAIDAPRWKHAESDHFIYHFFHGFVATQVAVEAEYYYRVFTAELERDTSRWERKCHIFLFEQPTDWKTFQKNAKLDPWTGGVHSEGELFLQRDPSFKWKGHTLGHEVAHLVLFRFFGAGLPLWLEEGYAEDAARRAYAAYFRARGYRAKPQAPAVAEELYIPLASLTAMVDYPENTEAVSAFYRTSQRLTRFLINAGRAQFVHLMEALGQGNRFDTALLRTYGSRFPNVEALEREFKPYALGATDP